MGILELEWCWNLSEFQVEFGWWVSFSKHFAIEYWENSTSLLICNVPFWMDRFWLIFINLRIFLHLPLPVEMVSPEGACIWVSLMTTIVVQAFECVGAEFSFLCFQSRKVDLIVCFAALSKFSVVLWLVRAITLNTFGALYSVQESGVAPFLAVLALGNSWVHVCSLDSNNVLSNIKAPVNEHLGIHSTLDVPNIDPYDGYIRFGRDFDDLGFGG